jgi:hypothetical protein
MKTGSLYLWQPTNRPHFGTFHPLMYGPLCEAPLFFVFPRSHRPRGSPCLRPLFRGPLGAELTAALPPLSIYCGADLYSGRCSYREKVTGIAFCAGPLAPKKKVGVGQGAGESFPGYFRKCRVCPSDFRKKQHPSYKAQRTPFRLVPRAFLLGLFLTRVADLLLLLWVYFNGLWL